METTYHQVSYLTPKDVGFAGAGCAWGTSLGAGLAGVGASGRLFGIAVGGGAV